MTIYSNAQGLMTNIEEFRKLCEEKDPDVLLLSETHITEDHQNAEINIADYNIVRCNSKSKHTGGVIAYVKNNLNFTIIDNFAVSKSWFLSIKIKNINLCVIYRSPREKLCKFFETFDDFLKKVVIGDPINVITGDFNINIEKNTKTVKDYYNLISEYGLKQIVKDYTRVDVRKNSCSIIDHVLTNNSKTFCTVNNYDRISDHNLIEISNDFMHMKKNAQMCKFVKKINIEQLLCKVNVPNESLGSLAVELKNVIEKNFVKYKPKLFKKKIRFNEKLLNLKNEKNKCLEKYYSTKNDVDYEVFSQKSKEYKRQLKLSKIDEYQNKIVKYKCDTKKLWCTLKTLYSEKSTEIRFINDGVKIIEDKKCIANVLNEFFVKSVTEIVLNIRDPNSFDYLDKIESPLEEFYITEIESKELTKIVCDNKDKNFNDFVSGKTLIEAIKNDEFLNLFLIHINRAITSSCGLNEYLKTCCITPIPKINNARFPEEFRPINNLPVIEKIMETIVLNQVTSFLESNKIICDNQHGFRKNHSTQSALISLLDKWIGYVEKKYTVVTIFLDFKRAFETVNKDILIEKLRKYNFSLSAVEWFENYLTNRKQYVKINDYKSDAIEVNNGVPQGSKLSSTLFNIYINDLIKNVDCDVVMYADDTSLTVASTSINDAILKLNYNLEKLDDWLKFNKIALNVKKCAYMVINNPNDNDIDVKIDNVIIERVSEIKYLGVQLDDKLKFNKYADIIIKKLNKKLGLFRRINGKLNDSCKLIFYKSLVQAHIDYCSFVFDFFDKSYVEKMRIIQNKFLRIITKSKKEEKIEAMLERSKIEAFDLRIQANILRTINKIVNGSCSFELLKKIKRNKDVRARVLRYGERVYVPNYMSSVGQKFIFFKAMLKYNEFSDFCKNNNNTFNVNVENFLRNK